MAINFEALHRIRSDLEATSKDYSSEAPSDLWVPAGHERKAKAWEIDRTTAQLLGFLALESEAETIVELGMSRGYSTTWLAEAAYRNGGHVFTFELDPEKIAIAERNFEEIGFENITIISGKIADNLKKFEHYSDDEIDFAFFDADKPNNEGYLDEIELRLAPGAVAVVDNLGDYGYEMGRLPERMQEYPWQGVSLRRIGSGVIVAAWRPDVDAPSAGELVGAS